ncbi:hypothetical protein [uncultured Draconibacterium sp.]|uniref:hypothetical protein n=1 Tax=uncultured Draconibacterium sp. TaxID=1573823 RepID=UPI002AA6D778|nr:hypothetical protein [uncultured Draconibacterium sp.]
MDNKINFTIPPEVTTQVNEALAGIATLLKPYLLALSPDERRALPKMSDKTLPFVVKALDYVSREPQFAPPYLNVEGLTNDMTVHSQLTPILRQVRILSDNLDDTTMEAGAESYVAALMYYNSVKMAAKMDIPGAKSIYDDLSKRFEKTTSESEETTAETEAQ